MYQVDKFYGTNAAMFFENALCIRNASAMRLTMHGLSFVGFSSVSLRVYLFLPNNQTLGAFSKVGSCLATSPLLPESCPYRRVLFRMGDCIAGLRQS